MILVPLDASKTSLTSLIIAKSLCLLLNLPLHIIHISDTELTKEELFLKLSLNVNDLPDHVVEHGKGEPAKLIIERAKQAKYVVMCTHGETCDLARVMGTTSLEIIENVTVPVLLVKPNILISLEKELWCPKKALIPLNGAPGSAQALIPAVNILAKTSREIDLLHIATCKCSKSMEVGTLTTPYYMDHVYMEWNSWAKEFLMRFGHCLKNHKNNVKINLHVSNGEPAEEILSFVKKNGNDIIAMAWHGELGHMKAQVFHKVIKETPCPLLLIRIA